VFFKLLKIVGVIFEMAADGANGQVPHQEAIRNHERKYEKAKSVEPLQDQAIGPTINRTIKLLRRAPAASFFRHQ